MQTYNYTHISTTQKICNCHTHLQMVSFDSRKSSFTYSPSFRLELGSWAGCRISWVDVMVAWTRLWWIACSWRWGWLCNRWRACWRGCLARCLRIRATYALARRWGSLPRNWLLRSLLIYALLGSGICLLKCSVGLETSGAWLCWPFIAPLLSGIPCKLVLNSPLDSKAQSSCHRQITTRIFSPLCGRTF